MNNSRKMNMNPNMNAGNMNNPNMYYGNMNMDPNLNNFVNVDIIKIYIIS